MQRIQLKISHKGLILVAVPLLFEILFVIILVNMLRASEQEAADLAQSREVVACTSELENALAYAGYALSSWKITQSDILVKRYDALVEKSTKLSARLTELAKYRPRIQADVARVNDTAAKIIFLTSNFRRPQDSAMLSFLNKTTYVGQIQRAYENLSDATQALTEEEQTVQRGGSVSEERVKTTIYVLIAAAVCFNIALTVALAVYFSRNITKRLAVLTENSKRLADGNALNEPMTGYDEIASLDTVFHKMAQDLQDTEQRKQEFVSMITHDLRTPLTAMRTVSATLAERAEARRDEDDGQRITVLQRSLDRMINLVNDLLEMDKIEAGLLVLEFASSNFNDILKNSIESVQHLADQRGIKLAIESEDVNVEVDEKRMGQVIVNLVANAIKFSPRGSTIYVVTRSDSASLIVEVIDQGRGIPEQNLESIFDRFKQVEHSDSSSRGGSGLGLSIAKALVELHQGTIGVKSRLGEGSTFWFRFPLRHSEQRVKQAV